MNERGNEMLDFLQVSTRSAKKGVIEIYPKFVVTKTNDLMIRGNDFYAIWDEKEGLWSTDNFRAIELIDEEIRRYAKEHSDHLGDTVHVLTLSDTDTNMLKKWNEFCKHLLPDHYHQLDEKVIFANDTPKKRDYASKKLPYPLIPGETTSYNKLMSTLYSEEERHKIEWAIGSIVTGDSRKIQKFLVLYGSAGTGKSTVLNIILKLFEGYCASFDAKALTSNSNAFALEPFRANPLVAVQQDGDLSKIEDNTKLNSIVSHERMIVNEKFKNTYESRMSAFLFMGTNKPVRITEAKSGLMRRLIDVHPTGNILGEEEYNEAMHRIQFELGAIAYHCKEVYLNNPKYYNSYTPKNMMAETNDFYDFILDSYLKLQEMESITVQQAWEMYKEYCDQARVPYPYSRKNFKAELRNYFRNFELVYNKNSKRRVETYSDFIEDKVMDHSARVISNTKYVIDFKKQASIFDKEYAEYVSQYANEEGTPNWKWENVKTHLKDLDTSRLHYVKLPIEHIVIDFDLTDEKGEKCFELNLEAASKWKPTYAELSKSGQGIHLHYIYEGDPNELSRIYDDKIEVKIFTGGMSLRRKLTKCNNLPIATINSGLPLKGENKKVIDFEGLKNEKALRTVIKRNLQKEYHGSTKQSIDFIAKALNDAHDNGMKYDVTDLRNAVLAFGANSTNNAEYCIKMVSGMPFKSEEESVPLNAAKENIVFFDIEVFPNLFVVCYKEQGPDHQVIKMINPDEKDIHSLMRYNLVGFNNRRYDNHILYARSIGYSIEALYNLSQKIINGSRNGMIREAYNVSYTDIYDFAATKQSLKKWEIELGIHHQELGFPWDKPVPNNMWDTVADYCANDVIATEAAFDHLQPDWNARKILATLTGMSVNDTTNTLTTRFIFGTEKNPQLVYTDLATGEASNPKYQRTDIITAFPGYEYANGKNMYRGDDIGRGGYVYAEPGMYWDVALLDVASMHPHSILAMNMFGEYTKKFKELLDVRMAIKHGEYEKVRHMFDGKLAPYLTDAKAAKDLAYALKIAINSVYGLTSASFENAFYDPRNVNNIVALRGGLFMRTLQDEVQKRGFTVAHIKTDSIKIPNATPEIIQFVIDFGKQYGYTFEHEATYERMCLVNDAVYIAKYKDGDWTATGKQFAVPYVFKNLFSHEQIELRDLCVTYSTQTALYLDMNEDLPDVTEQEKELERTLKKNKTPPNDLIDEIDDGHNYMFVGKVGLFCPIIPGGGGGELVRSQGDKFYSASGASGYRWLEEEQVKREHKESLIDTSYFNKLAADAIDTINKFGDFEMFTSEDHPFRSKE